MPGQTPQDPRQAPYRAAPRQVRTPVQHANGPLPRRTAPPQPVYRRVAPPPPPDPELQARRRAAARRQRQIRRNRRRFAFAVTVVGILAVSGIITLLLPAAPTAPADSQPADSQPAAPPAAAGAQLVAPLPYNGGSAAAPAQTLDWGRVGPVRQTGPYTYTAVPAAPPATLPESGKVDITWFSDAAFLGDSITAGLQEYNINLSGGLVCGYVGASPNQIVNRTALTNSERGEEVALDVLTERAPRKVYVLMGTNALRLGGATEGFLNYYGAMLDALRAALPEAAIYVQPVLPVRPEALADSPGLAAESLNAVNSALLALCEEKGCWFVDLREAFTDETGALREDYAEADGIHLKKAAYSVWLDYLCTHVPYDKRNPYQPGAPYYISDALKALLADIP